jgi:hypothetical protein
MARRADGIAEMALAIRREIICRFRHRLKFSQRHDGASSPRRPERLARELPVTYLYDLARYRRQQHRGIRDDENPVSQKPAINDEAARRCNLAYK